MRITGKVEGHEKLQRALSAISGAQLNKAISEGINMGAGRAKNMMRSEMQSVFDRPTRYILQSVQVQKKATPESLEALIAPVYLGGQGGDPQDILGPHEVGERRPDKRSEVRLRRAKLLPNGYQTAIPAVPFPGSDDGHGNLKGKFIVQLLSYLQTFGNLGDSGNMSDRRKQSIHRRGGKGARFVGPVRGHRFFVAGVQQKVWTVEGGEPVYKAVGPNRGKHLAPGIWAAMSGGRELRPVLMFVKAGVYKTRISLDQIREKSGVDQLVPRWIRGRIYEAWKNGG